MNYRAFHNIGMEVSALGFGCMRLPTTGRDADIDEHLARDMIRYAVDKGVNYVDTAYPYHDGSSEKFLGKALKDGYRERVKLATKSPLWLIKKADDFERFFCEQLGRLQTDYVDFYLFHSIQKESWHALRKLGMLEWGEKARADGRIRYLGFSFHDDFEAFKMIIDGYDGWSVCQIQYNYMNEDTQAGTKGLRYAADRGVSVIIMEPLLGGHLANPPEKITNLFAGTEAKRTPADWALQWLWNKPEVSMVLSGMSTMEQVSRNIESACRSGVGTFTTSDLELVARVKEAYNGFFPVPCTQCKYCMPCPNGIDIPRNLALYNEAVAFQLFALNKNIYKGVLSKEEQAGACIQCGECEDKCPQHIKIVEWLIRIHRELSG